MQFNVVLRKMLVREGSAYGNAAANAQWLRKWKTLRLIAATIRSIWAFLKTEMADSWARTLMVGARRGCQGVEVRIDGMRSGEALQSAARCRGVRGRDAMKADGAAGKRQRSSDCILRVIDKLPKRRKGELTSCQQDN